MQVHVLGASRAMSSSSTSPDVEKHQETLFPMYELQIAHRDLGLLPHESLQVWPIANKYFFNANEELRKMFAKALITAV